MTKSKPDIMLDRSLNNEPELLEPVLLCDGRGDLNPLSIGWSRQPVFNCNLARHWFRKKKWNYWNITSEKYLFCVAITNLDYSAIAITYLYNLESNVFTEKTLAVPFGKGCSMPDNVKENIHFKNKGINLSFTEEKNYTKIYVECQKFKGEVPLNAEFIIEHPDNLETLNVVIPWDKKRFQFTSKQNCLPAIGTVTIGDEVHYFKTGETFASLDFGRGIWPRNTFWNWATMSGIYEGKSIGLNLGGGWTDGTGMTENAVLFDGRIYKISDNMIFDYSRDDFMKPWRIKTQNSDSVEIEFIPFYNKIVTTNLVLVKSNMHQVFGHFSGSIVLDNKEKLTIQNMLGCVEEHYAKW